MIFDFIFKFMSTLHELHFGAKIHSLKYNCVTQAEEHLVNRLNSYMIVCFLGTFD